MDSSLRLVPAGKAKNVSVQNTAGSLGLHDTMQYGLRSFATEVQTTSTIRDRLENWQETQDNLKLNLQRNIYGLHAPMRLLMERKMVSRNPHMPAMRQSNVHLDILMGRDEEIEVCDVFDRMDATAPALDIHAEMERKLKM